MTMTSHATKSAVVAGLTVASILFSAGCQEPPPTNTDEVVEYVRNGVVGADVRRLNPEAQAYVDAVFKAYRNWQAACAPIEAIGNLDALWPKDNAEWRDAEQVAARLKAVREWQADEPNPKKSDAKTRAQWYEAIPAAVAEVPALPAGETTDLAGTVRAELDPEPDAKRYDRIAARYEHLLGLVEGAADDFDPKQTGLAFKTAATTEQVLAAWTELHSAFVAAREVELDHIERLLTEGVELRATAIKEKRELRMASGLSEAQQRRFRSLELLVRYYDARIRYAERRKKKLDQAAATSGD